MTAFGDLLKDARRRKGGISQQKLADMLTSVDGGVTGSTIGFWERGKHSPRAPQDRHKIAALEEALDVAPGSFFAALGLVPDGDGATPQVSLEEREDRIAEALGRLADIQAAQTAAVIALQEEQAAGTAALLALVEQLRSRRVLPPDEEPPPRAG